jgi:transposase
MIHKVKALHDEGRGLSIRAIGQQLGIARNTVRKYLRQDTEQIAQDRGDRSRQRRLDAHRPYIEHLLRRYPRLSAVKVARKLHEKVGELDVSDRTLRRYVGRLKETIAVAQPRYYAPVLDLVPAVQCQVDPGELRGVLIGGVERTVYFVVFVLSYSRLMHVGVSLQPLDTARLIELHDEALRAFGGVPEECVYDQTKMVVIAEQFRELTVNERFHQYATTAGFTVQACRGYDPESKGKVEAGVKYVKRDCLYGETFSDEADLRGHVQQWLDEVANVRIHGTTGRAPHELFAAEEAAHLRSYQPPAAATSTAEAARRKVDKTGLISWRANKYTVPMRYQRGAVDVVEDGGELHIIDPDSGERVARHGLANGKGELVRNVHHYRDPSQRVADLEQAIAARLGDELGGRLCARLQASEPRYYKDQLAGLEQLLAPEPLPDLALLEDLATREGTTATTIKRFIDAHRRAAERGREADRAASTPPASCGRAELAAYAGLGQPDGQQEVTHEPA